MRTDYARNYGILPDSEKCQIENFRCMLGCARDTCFILEPGCYHFYKENAVTRDYQVTNSDFARELSVAILLERMENIVLDGQGAEFVFHGDMCALAVSECEKVTLRNFSIDFALPSSAEARVLRASKNMVDIAIDRTQFPYVLKNETLYFKRADGAEAPMFAAMEFDKTTGKVSANAGDTFPNAAASEPEPGVVRLEPDYTVVPREGNLLVLRHGKRIHPGVLVQYSADTVIEQVDIYQTCGLGIVFQFCENITVRETAFKAAEKRGRKVLSGHDDGLHFSNNKGEVLIEHCHFAGLMDDSVNVHGTAARLNKRQAKCIMGTFCHPQSKGFPRWAVEGDRIGFINPRTRACEAVATAQMYRLLSDEQFELVLDREFPKSVTEGYALENLTNTPSLICRNNYFGSHRARGLLVTTPKPVLIEDNVFESSGSAILLAGDVNEWYESGTCTEVVIRRNRFKDCLTSEYQFCHGVIDIEPGIGKDEQAMVHSNIHIVDNEFYLVSDAMLFAEHVRNLEIKRNRIFMRAGFLTPRYHMLGCEEVCCEENVVDIKSNR